MKFWHITVIDGYKIVFQKKCLTVGEANTMFKEKKEEYKDQKSCMVMKENF